MISAVLQLVRTSLPSLAVLALSLFTLTSLLSGDPDATAPDASAIPSLAPLATDRKPPPSAVMRSALFDPARRPETIAGSIDDLRSGQGGAASPVTIAGVMLSGRSQKAMLSLGGGAPAWDGVGAEVGGWRVMAIDPEGAVLERDGQSITLKVADRFKLRGKPAEAGGTKPGQDIDGGAPASPPGETSDPSQPAPP